MACWAAARLSGAGQRCLWGSGGSGGLVFRGPALDAGFHGAGRGLPLPGELLLGGLQAAVELLHAAGVELVRQAGILFFPIGAAERIAVLEPGLAPGLLVSGHLPVIQVLKTRAVPGGDRGGEFEGF